MWVGASSRVRKIKEVGRVLYVRTVLSMCGKVCVVSLLTVGPSLRRRLFMLKSPPVIQRNDLKEFKGQKV